MRENVHVATSVVPGAVPRFASLMVLELGNNVVSMWEDMVGGSLAGRRGLKPQGTVSFLLLL